MILSRFLHGFVKIDTWSFLGCYMDLSKLLYGFVEVGRDRSGYQNGRIFGKPQGGGGGIFNPKNYVADFGPLKRAFFRMLLKKIAS